MNNNNKNGIRYQGRDTNDKNANTKNKRLSRNRIVTDDYLSNSPDASKNDSFTYNEFDPNQPQHISQNKPVSKGIDKTDQVVFRGQPVEQEAFIAEKPNKELTETKQPQKSKATASRPHKVTSKKPKTGNKKSAHHRSPVKNKQLGKGLKAKEDGALAQRYMRFASQPETQELTPSEKKILDSIDQATYEATLEHQVHDKATIESELYANARQEEARLRFNVAQVRSSEQVRIIGRLEDQIRSTLRLQERCQQEIKSNEEERDVEINQNLVTIDALNQLKDKTTKAYQTLLAKKPLMEKQIVEIETALEQVSQKHNTFIGNIDDAKASILHVLNDLEAIKKESEKEIADAPHKLDKLSNEQKTIESKIKDLQKDHKTQEQKIAAMVAEESKKEHVRSMEQLQKSIEIDSLKNVDLLETEDNFERSRKQQAVNEIKHQKQNLIKISKDVAHYRDDLEAIFKQISTVKHITLTKRNDLQLVVNDIEDAKEELNKLNRSAVYAKERIRKTRELANLEITKLNEHEAAAEKRYTEINKIIDKKVAEFEVIMKKITKDFNTKNQAIKKDFDRYQNEKYHLKEKLLNLIKSTKKDRDYLQKAIIDQVKYREAEIQKTIDRANLVVTQRNQEVLSTSSELTSQGGTALEVNGLTKVFEGVAANNNVTFNLRKGEILAIVGENGAGKSTLVSMIYGLLKPDSGSISVNGHKRDIGSPTKANKLGIGLLPQHYQMVDDFNAIDNIALGHETNHLGIISSQKIMRQLKEIIDRYSIDVDLIANAGRLPIGQKQKVEILKLLWRNLDIMIFDEPTAVLSEQEINDFITMVKLFKKEGKSIIVITHKFKEVFALSDRVAVMRKGEIVTVRDTRTLDSKKLSRLMVGKSIELQFEKKNQPQSTPVLNVQSLSYRDERGVQKLRNVNLTINAGEILGIAGVDGNGQKELCESIVGILQNYAGTVQMGSRRLDKLNAHYRFKHHISFIPEERQTQGLDLDSPVKNNLVMKDMNLFSTAGFIRQHKINKFAAKSCEEFNIVAAEKGQAVTRYLSGGNQQKIVVARELARRPSLIVASQPTRGLDLGAVYNIYDKLIEARDNGVGILLVSGELDELLAVSDRLAVIFEGRILDILDPHTASRDKIEFLMAGGDDGDVRTSAKKPVAKSQAAAQRAASVERN